MTPLAGLRVCMATSAHRAADDRIFIKEARSLEKAGADVTILYAAGKDDPDDEASMHFVRYDTGGGLRRRVLKMTALQRALAAGRFDAIHCHEPDSLLAALRTRQDTGSKVVFDSHEMWAASAAGRLPRPLWTPVAASYRLLERRWLAQCDAAIGASWAISDYLATVLPEERVATILNVPVPEVFGEWGPRQWGEETVVCHDGHLPFDRGLAVMAEAIRLVSSKHRVVFKIVGDVFGAEREWLDGFAQTHGLSEVIVRTGWLPYEEVGRALAPCHIGLIALRKIPNNIVTSSNKVFNYMYYGMPFVGPDFRLSKQKLVAEERCGVLADSSSPESYALAICRLIEDREGTLEMGRRALQASRDRYRWQHMEPVLVALYERMLAAGPSACTGL